MNVRGKRRKKKNTSGGIETVVKWARKCRKKEMGCFTLKARWVEYSQELWIKTGTSGLLDAFGFIQLVLPKHMKML